MKIDHQETISYSDKNKDIAIEQIDGFQSDLGGTEILMPLKVAQYGLDSFLKRRIFLLTDGCVSSPGQLVQQAARESDQCRLFTFGLGSGCDEYMV